MNHNIRVIVEADRDSFRQTYSHYPQALQGAQFTLPSFSINSYRFALITPVRKTTRYTRIHTGTMSDAPKPISSVKLVLLGEAAVGKV